MDKRKTVLKEKQADRLIDYGELTRRQYRDKYSIRDKEGKIIKEVNSGSTAGLNYKQGLLKLKGFTDD